MHPQNYHQKWKKVFLQMEKQCILRPPPMPTSHFTPSIVESHMRKLRTFHRTWGSWWMWLLCMPFLWFMVVLRRLVQHILLIFTIVSVWNMYERISFLRFLLVPLAVLFHLLGRYLFLIWLVPKDLISLFQRNAFWREPSCFSPMIKIDKNIGALNLTIVDGLETIPFNKVFSWRSTLSDKTQDTLSGGTYLFLSLLVYYSVMFSTSQEHFKEDFFIGFIAYTVMIFWPVPLGLIWMMFAHKVFMPMIKRIFYTPARWNYQHPHGMWGPPMSDRRLLWYLILIGALWFFFFR